MKVAVVGSRDFPNLGIVCRWIEANIPNTDLLISGGASGVDATAERTHMGRGGTIRSIKPDWKTYGKRAGFVRNQQIIDEAERVVVFWDGESKGAKHDIDIALATRKHLEVIFP